MIKNGDDTNVLGTIATFAPHRTDNASYAPAGNGKNLHNYQRRLTKILCPSKNRVITSL